MLSLSRIGIFLLSSAAGFGQAGPQFEVASVKQNPSGSPMGGGPGMRDGRFYAQNIPFSRLLSYAYGVRLFQVSGPDWIERERYDIAASPPH